MHSTQIEYGLKTERDRIWLLQKAKELGFHGIELGIGLDYLNDPLWTGDGYIRQAIREKAQLSGIEAASICLHMLNYKENSLASDKVKHRNVGREIIQNTIEACAYIGASVILVPFFGTAILKSEKQILLLISELKWLSTYAEDNDVCLSLETSLKAPELARIVESIGSDYVQIYFDTGNIAGRGYNIVHEIETLGEYIVQVHVKDNPSRTLGEGNIDFNKTIEALKKIGFDGYLVLETPALDDSAGAASRNLIHLRRIVEGY